MTDGDARTRIGLALGFAPSRQAIEAIARAEAAGIATVWSIMSPVGYDLLTTYAAAFARTERVTLGTAIVPAFTRHPLAMASQAVALEDLAPGRLRLGIGTAHARTMRAMFHFPFDRPLSQLREYVSVLRPGLRDGEVHFAGDFYHVDATLPAAPGTPVLIAALREPAFRLAGELTDGAISWLCPVAYLLERALPAVAVGAAAAGRARPPLVAHVPVVLREDRDAVRAIARANLAYYASAPFYARMFADAGYPLAPDGTVTDALIDDLVVSGDAAAIGTTLRERLGRGLDELLVSVLPGDDRAADERGLIEALGRS